MNFFRVIKKKRNRFSLNKGNEVLGHGTETEKSDSTEENCHFQCVPRFLLLWKHIILGVGHLLII